MPWYMYMWQRRHGFAMTLLSTWVRSWMQTFFIPCSTCCIGLQEVSCIPYGYIMVYPWVRPCILSLFIGMECLSVVVVDYYIVWVYNEKNIAFPFDINNYKILVRIRYMIKLAYLAQIILHCTKIEYCNGKTLNVK